MELLKHSFIRWWCVAIVSVIFAFQAHSSVTDPTSVETSETENEVNSSTGSTIVVTTENLITTDDDSDTENQTNESTTAPSVLPTAPTSAVPRIKDISSPYFCPCDNVLNSCEFNCCCDPDCSEKVRAVFSACVDEDAFEKIAESRDSRRCYRRDFVFWNNTVYKTKISRNGLFCVVTDNVKKDQQFPDANVNLDRISAESRLKYIWHLDKPSDILNQNPSKYHYKYGHQIQLAKPSDIDPKTYIRIGMVMPTAVFGLTCNAKSAVTFLQNQESYCKFPIVNLSLQCQSTKILDVNKFISDSMIVANPSLNLIEENLKNFTYLLCTPQNSPFNCTRTTTLMSPFYNQETSSCDNVLSQLDLVFKHDGVKGIVHIMAHIYYSNYSSSITTIPQKFSTSYEWEIPDEDDIHQHPPRLVSGNPGYIIGKPVKMGPPEKVRGEDFARNRIPADKTIRDALEKQEFIINPNLENLTVLSPWSCGNPEHAKRKNVLFGYDVSVSCLLEYTRFRSCHYLQQRIWKILFGMSPNNFTRRFVATIGNPHSLISSHWIPWRPSGDPFKDADPSFRAIDTGCQGVVAAMHLNFVFAHVGFIHYPQLKILGAYVHFGGSMTIPRKPENVTRESSIFVTTTVKFTDTTPPPVTPLPKWPIISISLPQDFFYPFSMSTSGGPSSKLKFLGIPMLLVFIFEIVKRSL